VTIVRQRLSNELTIALIEMRTVSFEH